MAPSNVTGRQIRVTIEGRRVETIFVDPLDKDLMLPRFEAMASAYKNLTTHQVHFEFSKLTTFQQKKIALQKKSASKE